MKKSKGFTLVEVIVVLVILTILAAILIPTLTRYIDKANEKTVIAECRSVVMASQVALSEGYAGDPGISTFNTGDALALAEVPGSIVSYAAKSGKLLHLTYKNGDKSASYCSLGGCADCSNDDTYTIEASVAVTRQAAADNALSGLTSQFRLTGFSGDHIDGVNAATEGTFAKTMFDSLPEADREFLNSISWSVVKSRYGYRLYFTDTNYGTGSATNIKVYKYDMDTAKYQYTMSGKVVDGAVKAEGQTWSDWSDTMD